MLTPQEAAKHLLKLKKAEDSFEGFIRLHNPKWKLPDFHKTLIGALDKLEKGIGPRNLLITMPPRHGKSTFGSVFFPAYFMARKPSRFIMSTSYNSQLATDFGRQVRDLVNDPLTMQAFPDLEMSQDSRAVDQWRTTGGGAAYFIGVGGTTTGRAANILLLDDPLKSREEAESATQRNKVWDFYVSGLSTRLQPDLDGQAPSQIIILTRWHPDDIAGRLMETDDWSEGRWQHINFQAITEKVVRGVEGKDRRQLPSDDPNYITPEQARNISKQKRYMPVTERIALWPDRFSLDDLERRERLNPREFASLYQQSPFIEGGNLIKAHWWRTYPSDMKPEQFNSLIIAADTAFKVKSTSDYSVMITMGLDKSGDIYIVDIHRDRYEFPDLKRKMIMLNNQWRGKGLRGIYIEDKASGQSLIQELKRESGVAVIPYRISTDKVTRLSAVLPLIEGGRVLLPDSATWLDTFHDECQTFPSGIHDDQIDALSIGLDVLARTPSTGEYYKPPSFITSKKDSGIFSHKSDLNSGISWRNWGE